MSIQHQRRKGGRPKGSRNKSTIRKDGTLLRKVFRKERVSAIETLSAESGIGILDVIDDMAAEGLTVLREDVYAQIIKFRKRKGAVIHEQRLEQRTRDLPEENGETTRGDERGQAVEDPDKDAQLASIFLESVKSPQIHAPAPPLDVDPKRGHEEETAGNFVEFEGNELVEPGEIEPDLPL